jgi:hypothetical protein
MNTKTRFSIPGLLAFFFCLSILCVSSCSTSRTEAPKGSGNFIAPDYVRKDYKKILVICRIDPDTYRKRVEKGVVDELKGRRFQVGAAYEFVTQDMVRDTARLRSTLEGMGYDAAILLTYLGQMTSVSDEYTYNGNMYNILGGAYPTMNLTTQAQKTAYFQADFFTAGTRGTRWRSSVRAMLGRDLDIATQQMAMELRKKLQADGIL